MPGNRGRILFVADDVAGGKLLAAVAPLVRARGFDIVIVATGPSVEVFTKDGWQVETVCKSCHDHPSRFGKVDLLVTGTSLRGNLERLFWEKCEARSSLAFIDTWFNFRNRFERGGAIKTPAHIGVIDGWCRRKIMSQGWCGARLHETGQPNLERMREELAPKRKTTRKTPTITYFTELLSVTHPDGPDEFEVARRLAEALADLGRPEWLFKVKPHPILADTSPWYRWHEALAARSRAVTRIDEAPTEDLICETSIVTAVTSMILIEAEILDIPALSVRWPEVGPLNPALDCFEGLEHADIRESLAPALARLINQAGRNEMPSDDNSWLEGSRKKACDLIEALATG